MSARQQVGRSWYPFNQFILLGEGFEFRIDSAELVGFSCQLIDGPHAKDLRSARVGDVDGAERVLERSVCILPPIHLLAAHHGSARRSSGERRRRARYAPWWWSG